MWISKKKWQEREDKIKKISSDLYIEKNKLDVLIEIHETYFDAYGQNEIGQTCLAGKNRVKKCEDAVLFYDGFNCKHIMHSKETANTKTIPNVTLEELARYVDRKSVV